MCFNCNSSKTGLAWTGGVGTAAGVTANWAAAVLGGVTVTGCWCPTGWDGAAGGGVGRVGRGCG